MLRAEGISGNWSLSLGGELEEKIREPPVRVFCRGAKRRAVYICFLYVCRPVNEASGIESTKHQS